MSTNTIETNYKCPVCGENFGSSRYPTAICVDCQTTYPPVDSENRPITFRNEGIHGGFISLTHTNNKIIQSINNVCWINGIKASAQAARFGGIVIQSISHLDNAIDKDTRQQPPTTVADTRQLTSTITYEKRYANPDIRDTTIYIEQLEPDDPIRNYFLLDPSKPNYYYTPFGDQHRLLKAAMKHIETSNGSGNSVRSLSDANNNHWSAQIIHHMGKYYYTGSSGQTFEFSLLE
jgi:hypothetical protein